MSTSRRKALFPREGLGLDSVISAFRMTILNPTLTLPILLFLQYTTKGRSLIHSRGWAETGLKRLGLVVCWGVLAKLNDFLSKGFLNNWTVDKVIIEDEIVVVTGGSSGIGAAIVKDFMERGAKVVVLDVQDLTFDAPSNVHFYKVDLSSASAITKVAAQIREEIGNPTVLINNAGVYRGRSILESTEKDVQLTFNVNALSHFFLVQQFLPAMAEANHGHIVTVASMGGYFASSRMVDYGCTKASAVAFHEGLSVELKMRYNAPKVRTTLVTPGHVATPLTRGFNNPSSFITPALEPATMAEAVVEKVLLCESGHIILPKLLGLFSGMRGWSHWAQCIMRIAISAGNNMDEWTGVQVLDPNAVAVVEDE